MGSTVMMEQSTTYRRVKSVLMCDYFTLHKWVQSGYEVVIVCLHMLAHSFVIIIPQ